MNVSSSATACPSGAPAATARASAGSRVRAHAGGRALVLAGVGFHVAYAFFHVGHAWGHDVPLVHWLSPIPLFGTFVASAGCALVLASLGCLSTRDEWRLAPSRLLTIAIVLFVFAITVWPLAHVHGHVGWLTALALAHPALLLWNPRRRALTVCAAATLLATATGGLGALLYPTYRTVIKPALFMTTRVAGLAFERKEHFGVAAVVLAWIGLAAHRAACRDLEQRELGRVAFVAYAGAAALAILTAALGTYVSVERSF